MFAFVSAFPKSLHCTDEAQQAETVLSAVLSIYIYIYIYILYLYLSIYICLLSFIVPRLMIVSVKLEEAGSKFCERFWSWKDCVVALRLRKFSC